MQSLQVYRNILRTSKEYQSFYRRVLVGDSFRTKHPRGLNKHNTIKTYLFSSTLLFSMHLFTVEIPQILLQKKFKRMHTCGRIIVDFWNEQFFFLFDSFYWNLVPSVCHYFQESSCHAKLFNITGMSCFYFVTKYTTVVQYCFQSI